MEGVVIASAVELGEEKASTQDVVSALMEALVDPKMPQKHLLNDTPPEDIQNSIAKQMHAVVLLYNCYHRKQNLELEFVKCKSFCKLAVLLRPSMIKFMKMLMVKGGEMLEENGAEDQLSVTEKAIKNACNIALSLYASKEVPITDEFPISKVAVLLIDSNKNNCFLQYGVVTEGVWSLIEKEINESSNSLEKLAEEKVCKKRKMDYQQPDSTYTSTYLPLGYEAMKDVAGIDSSDLVVLESHVVHSLNK